MHESPGRQPGASPSVELAGRALIRIYRSCYLLRRVEEEISARAINGEIYGPVHLSLGQEALAAIFCSRLRRDDLFVGHHRSHAHYLAKGGSFKRFVHELYGLDSGCSRGVGGSMHLYDRAAGFLGSSAILGGSVPIACGVAAAIKHLGSSGICVVLVGDGGAEQGSFYEGLNIAAVRNLPLLFLVENNRLATLTPIEIRQSGAPIYQKAASFGIESASVSCRDLAQVVRGTREAVERVRVDRRPYLLECHLPRLCDHDGPYYRKDVTPYVKDLSAWAAELDLVPTLRGLCVASLTETRVERMETHLASFVVRTFDHARELAQARSRQVRAELSDIPTALVRFH